MQTAATLNYSPDPTLTPVQHRAINMLAEGQTISAIAAALNLHRNTIGNWRRSVPAFARELEFAAREQSLYWHEQAAALAPKAIEVQCTILHNEDASPSLRLRAALAVVKMAADPHPKSLRPFPTATAEMEAAHGQLLAWERPAPTVQPAQTCTVQPIRRPVEPGSNSPCPCGSGVKFKRCCANQRSVPIAQGRAGTLACARPLVALLQRWSTSMSVYLREGKVKQKTNSRARRLEARETRPKEAEARELHLVGGGLLLLRLLRRGGLLVILLGGGKRNRAKSEREAEGGNHELFHLKYSPCWVRR